MTTLRTDDELVETVAKAIEDASTAEVPYWNGILLRRIAQAATEAATVELLKERDEARKALHGIANAVRLGAETDVLAWKNLADACQRTARAALTEKHNG